MRSSLLQSHRKNPHLPGSETARGHEAAVPPPLHPYSPHWGPGPSFLPLPPLLPQPAYAAPEKTQPEQRRPSKVKCRLRRPTGSIWAAAFSSFLSGRFLCGQGACAQAPPALLQTAGENPSDGPGHVSVRLSHGALTVPDSAAVLHPAYLHRQFPFRLSSGRKVSPAHTHPSVLRLFRNPQYPARR